MDFFQGAILPRGIAATMIILIPKKKNPTKWTEYRPISLCNVSNKIISKLIATRMVPLLPILTVPNQSGFIKGRLLKCNPSPNMALKLDMAKAYDRVQWPFLLKVLRKMGFSEMWLGLIERSINPCWFSILINGSPAGFFKSSRGLRQGDPLFPSLFILAADYLSRTLDRLILGNKKMRYCTARHTMGISHLAYADDIIIFTQARRASLRKLKGCLRHYMEVSGQKINEGMSCFFIDKKHEGWAAGITSVGGFQQGILPCTYLGVPIFRGRKKTNLFLFIREKISQKIMCWSHRHLSFGGRLTLVKSILEAIPVHIFQVLEPTKGALRMLEQVLARYFWGSCNTTNKTHWIKWKDICRPTSEGGLGLRCMADIVEAYSYKLWWRFREQNSLWAQFMYKKYWSISSSLNIYRSSRFSPIWRRMFKAGIKCQSLIKWMLGEGKISFWDDIWVKDQPISAFCSRAGTPPFVRVKDFWASSGWKKEDISVFLDEWGVPREVSEEIMDIPFNVEARDLGRWALTPHGNFSVSSAWELVRNRGEEREVFEFIWDRGIGPTISVFLWRLLANRIPVDEKIQWRGVSIASRCRCCVNPDIETRLHLFVNSEAAFRIWEHFARWFPYAPEFARRGNNLEGRLRWWQRHTGNKNKHHLCILIPCLICWFIWTERNGRVHHENVFKVENVCKRVVAYLRNLVLAGFLGPDQWVGCDPKVDFMEAQSRKSKVRKVEKVVWRPPEWPWLKVNTDGSFEGCTGRAGGGGVVRDHLGDIVEAFCTPVAASSGFEAELKSLLEGVKMAKRHGLMLWLETDAEMVRSLLEKRQLGPADSRHTMAKIGRELKELQWRVSCIRREGNKVADFLAKMGRDSQELERFEGGAVPSRAKALARLDQLGMPSFRF